MKKLLISIFALASIGSSSAQNINHIPTKKQAKKIQFKSINTMGLLVGSSGENFSVQTINGIAYKSWSVGIATGIDWYGTRSIPLLLDVRKSFTNNKNKPFVYANGGTSFAWIYDSNLNPYYTGIIAYYDNEKYKTSFTGEFGTGYTMPLKNKAAFVLSVGFSYKALSKYQTGAANFMGVIKTYNSTDYYYRRLALRLGLMF
jgi:hypothetical protein